MLRGVETYLAQRRRPPQRQSWWQSLGNPGRGDLTTTTAATTHASTPTPMVAVKAPKMRKARRHRPILRVLVALFVAVELLIYALVTEYAPVYNFQITMVYSAAGEEVGRNPELMYPIKLGGTLCSAPVLEACVEGEVDAADACCTELFDEDSDAAEELISNLMAIAFAGIIPGLILLVRGFLLGRLWDKRISEECQQAQNRDPLEGAWGKKRWHLRVGFYSLDTCLGLTASLATALAFTAVTKVLTGRPRPNYFALRAFSERAASGKDYVVESVLGWPSRTAAVSMAGLLFLAFVLWRDLMALVQWRRRSHPRVTLVLAVLGGFALATVPLAAILMGITRIRDFWHRPDDVLAGLVLGAVCAFWSFRFVVVMPFNHEIGAPEWTPEPTWVLEEEDALLEDSMMGCWKVGRKRPGGVGDAGAGGGVSRAPRPRVVHGESPAPLKFDSQPPQPPMQVSQATIDASAMKDDDSQA